MGETATKPAQRTPSTSKPSAQTKSPKPNQSTAPATGQIAHVFVEAGKVRLKIHVQGDVRVGTRGHVPHVRNSGFIVQALEGSVATVEVTDKKTTHQAFAGAKGVVFVDEEIVTENLDSPREGRIVGVRVASVHQESGNAGKTRILIALGYRQGIAQGMRGNVVGLADSDFVIDEAIGDSATSAVLKKKIPPEVVQLHLTVRILGR